MADPLFRYHRPGLAVEVYADRVEIERGALWQPRRRKVIVLRQVTAVSTEGYSGQKLRLDHAGGRDELVVGRDAEALRAVIAGRLP